MSYQNIIEHMNAHHQDAMIDLCKKFGNATHVENVRLDKVDFIGLDLVYNDNISLRVEFPQKCDENTLKDSIIKLCQSAKAPDTQAIATEIADFKKEFGSILIASINAEGEAICSYAPLIQIHNQLYIYISEVAEHFSSIQANPSKIEIMFLEDECKAKSVILRKRLRYRANARFVERDTQEFNDALKALESLMGGAGGIKTIKTMTDFHLIALETKKGRFVKGFGQAYDILPDGQIVYIGGKGNPHSRNPHKH
ncbi:HugZ family heme oxygenase [Helicobacter sp. MIT 05-5293]|uniref:HugZ family heme oxygenase n=1 Tax=Helicobacter sp. MIT 05-5293 TaxID=1548149 RepID=UPI00051DCFDD|nr:HugZ family heme oxygenase [Helicobacter sp. MIT 05-5293]TLD80862.1 HugZ family heme oxygenase [Helicobacter sp. MIT 05-5293]